VTALPPAPLIACFGAAHVDHKARALGPVALGSSNPVTISTSLGGVARNVAETLARLSCRTLLVSRVGTDAAGDLVLAAAARQGIDTSGVERSNASPTASYTAFLDREGEMVVALADMGIYDELTPEGLRPAVAAAAGADLWFLDANLPEPVIASLLASAEGGPVVAADAVSVAKAGRLVLHLGRIGTLFCNREEAAALAGHSVHGPVDVCEAASRLLGRGARAVVIGLGPDGCFAAAPGLFSFLPAVPARLCDVTGAGDALVAGCLFGLAAHRTFEEAVGLGLAAAAFAVEGEETVSPAVSAARLLARAGLGAEA
jgi:pseudouridine kinase